jgi:serine/threonine-protein kinase HipA
MIGTTRFGVHLATPEGTVALGSVETDARRGRTARVEFRYATSYLEARPGPALDPAHPLSSAPTVDAALPRGILDAGPDGWGRRLLLRARRGESLTEPDFVLSVDDDSRIGALRFSLPGSPDYVSRSHEIPRLVHLDDLAAAARAVEEDPDDLAAVRLLLDAGSANLGGIRPKASVRDNGRLTIAKFPSTTDEIDAMAWEKVCLDIAARAGVEVPRTRLVEVGRQRALLLDRFDRDGRGDRIPYLSAFSLTRAPDPAAGDYFDLAEDLREFDIADYVRAVRDLWRRIAVNNAVRNTDDHLRNHGFLYGTAGWALSPAFDITPNPVAGAERTTALDGETSPVREARALVALGDAFDIPRARQVAILDEVLAAAGTWRHRAEAARVAEREIRILGSSLTGAQARLAAERDRLT